MTFNFLGPGLTVNVEAKVKEQIILDSSGLNYLFAPSNKLFANQNIPLGRGHQTISPGC
ncbi:hypothetical protein [Parasutterella sp.]|uniref:hypothetical protein n=1 Tax=Parasutterella sp. TaxID=2049037 RepID=UPI0035223061